MSAPINQLVRELSALPGSKRRALLQRLIGHQVDPASADGKRILHYRALLVTRLNDAGVWPPR